MVFLKHKILDQFYKKMFLDQDVKLAGQTFALKRMKGLRFYKVGHLLFIEQNPEKKTRWATMARQGARILWVIDTDKNKYLYRILNGKVTKLV